MNRNIQPVDNGLGAQLKAIPASRVILIGMLLCLVIGFLFWRLRIGPALANYRMMSAKQIPPEEFDLLELANKKLEKDLGESKKRLDEERDHVMEVTTQKNISVTPSVYAEVVSALNALLDKNRLVIMESAENKSSKLKSLSQYVSQFSQRYIVLGEFTDVLSFLEDVNRLPFLCRITVNKIKAVEIPGARTLDKRAVNMDFELKLYYLQAKSK